MWTYLRCNYINRITECVERGVVRSAIPHFNAISSGTRKYFGWYLASRWRYAKSGKIFKSLTKGSMEAKSNMTNFHYPLSPLTHPYRLGLGLGLVISPRSATRVYVLLYTYIFRYTFSNFIFICKIITP